MMQKPRITRQIPSWEDAFNAVVPPATTHTQPASAAKMARKFDSKAPRNITDGLIMSIIFTSEKTIRR